MNLYPLIRPLLFRLEPEAAHRLTLNVLAAAHRIRIPQLYHGLNHVFPRQIMGLTFDNPVGLAAGLDKNADYVDALAALGFGFVEIGTVTPRPQPGNPPPRMFRLPKAQAIVNRMGFNSKGIDYVIEQVRKLRYQGVLGINIGKNFDTPIERAVDDYIAALRKIYRYASYVTINISSPNTQNLRQLQKQGEMSSLLQALKTEQTSLEIKHKKHVPLVIKIAPDLDQNEIRHIAKALLDHQIDGVIATNTTLSRQGVHGMPDSTEAGGMSGAPLTRQATRVVADLAQHLNGKIPIIASGGIMNTGDALDKMDAGASLIQLYSGLIYQGPKLVHDIAMCLRDN